MKFGNLIRDGSHWDGTRKKSENFLLKMGRDASRIWDGMGPKIDEMRWVGRDPKSMGRFWDRTQTWLDALGLGSKILSGTRPESELLIHP